MSLTKDYASWDKVIGKEWRSSRVYQSSSVLNVTQEPTLSVNKTPASPDWGGVYCWKWRIYSWSTSLCSHTDMEQEKDNTNTQNTLLTWLTFWQKNRENIIILNVRLYTNSIVVSSCWRKLNTMRRCWLEKVFWFWWNQNFGTRVLIFIPIPVCTWRNFMMT